LARLAWRFLGAYLERTGDYEGLATLRFYAVYRALVRAKIALIRSAQADTPAAEQLADHAALSRYIEVAQALAKPRAPQLILTCGVTGSGKTTVAQFLSEQLGALRLRSDLERKRLHGVAATDHLAAFASVGDGIYEATANERTYARLSTLASMVLDADTTTIVDASFLLRSHRQAFADLARACGVRFTIVECVAPAATLQARVAQRLARGDDASDATLQVLAHQLTTRESLSAQEQALAIQLDTDAELATLEARCNALARRLNSDPEPRVQTALTTAC
jgi:predicted kinase